MIVRELVNQIMPRGNFVSNFSGLIVIFRELKIFSSSSREVLLFEP
jgi:hypothetical protein